VFNGNHDVTFKVTRHIRASQNAVHSENPRAVLVQARDAQMYPEYSGYPDIPRIIWPIHRTNELASFGQLNLRSAMGIYLEENWHAVGFLKRAGRWMVFDSLKYFSRCMIV